MASAKGLHPWAFFTFTGALWASSKWAHSAWKTFRKLHEERTTSKPMHVYQRSHTRCSHSEGLFVTRTKWTHQNIKGVSQMTSRCNNQMDRKKKKVWYFAKVIFNLKQMASALTSVYSLVLIWQFSHDWLRQTFPHFLWNPSQHLRRCHGFLHINQFCVQICLPQRRWDL